MRLIGVIDPGHGGKDPGAIGAKLKIAEKDLTLAYALDLGKELISRGHSITLTRRKDEYLSLGSRTEIANNLRPWADFFVSIHFDANRNSAAQGTWAFYHNTISYADGRPIKETPSRLGQPLAGCLVKHVVESAGTRNRGTAPRPMYKFQDGEMGKIEGQLYVLRQSKPWASLIEIGFLSNPEDEANVVKDEFRQRVVQGMANGIETWAKNYL